MLRGAQRRSRSIGVAMRGWPPARAVLTDSLFLMKLQTNESHEANLNLVPRLGPRSRSTTVPCSSSFCLSK